MGDKTQDKTQKETQIKLELVTIEAREKDKKGKIVVSKRPDTNEINYIRNDIVGLMTLLRRFDTKLHIMRDWKMSVKIKDKLSEAYLNDFKEIRLTLDEAAFLKNYLQELPEKEGKQESISEFEIRTMISIQEIFR